MEQRSFGGVWAMFAVPTVAYGIHHPWAIGYVLCAGFLLGVSWLVGARVRLNPRTSGRLIVLGVALLAVVALSAVDVIERERARWILLLPLVVGVLASFGRFGYYAILSMFAMTPWVLRPIRALVESVPSTFAATAAMSIAAALVFRRQVGAFVLAPVVASSTVVWFVFLEPAEPFGCWGPQVSQRYTTTLWITMVLVFLLGPIVAGRFVPGR